MDQKKLDRLIKLAKLANHNPNDEEANSAARALAKMFSEDNYKWIETTQKNGGSPPKSPYNTSKIDEDPLTNEIIIRISRIKLHSSSRLTQLFRQLQDELNKPTTWNDVHRSSEPQWRSKPPPPKDQYRGEKYQPFDDVWEDFIRDFDNRSRQRARQQEYRRAQNEERKKQEEREFKAKQAQTWTWESESAKGYKKVYKQTVRDCTVCNITRLTSDEEIPYVCYECKRKV